MKRINFLLAFLMLATVSFMSSCSSDEETDETKPTIAVEEVDSPTYVKGTIVKYKCTLGGNEKITHFSVAASPVVGGDDTKAYGVNADEQLYKEGSTYKVTGELEDGSKTSRTIYFEFQIPATTNETSTKLTFTVKDKNDKSETKEMTIEIKEATTTTAFGAEATGTLSHRYGAGAGAYDLVNQKVMMEADAAADKDMENISSATDITFVAGWKAGTGNTSTFAKVSDLDYATASVEAAKAKFDAASPSAEIASVVEGDVVVAKLRNGKYSIMKITKVDADDATKAGKGKMTFTFKKGEMPSPTK